MDAEISRLPGPPEPSYVPPDDVVALALVLGQVDAAHRRLRTRVAKRLGLTVHDLVALVIVSDTEETTPKHLAAELGLTSGTVTSTIDRLVDAGQVVRTPKAGDRRSVLIELTPEGASTIEVVGGLYMGAVAVVAETSPELFDRKILDSLRHTADALDAVADRDADGDVAISA